MARWNLPNIFDGIRNRSNIFYMNKLSVFYDLIHGVVISEVGEGREEGEGGEGFD